MRLVVSAQLAAEQRLVAEAFDTALRPEVQQLLGIELGRTACARQTYSVGRRGAAAASEVGPAFLCYYAPAFVRHVAKTTGTVAGTARGLVTLAAICRGARQLWPLCAGAAGETVVLHLGAIKGEKWQRETCRLTL